MHKFLRAIGFSDIRKKDLEMILDDIIECPDVLKVTKDSEGNEFAELTFEVAQNMGIKVCGSYEEDDHFHMDYYYPYLTGSTVTSQEQIEVQKHAEKESYAGVCDEVSLGVTLIFYIQNVADLLAEKRIHERLIIQGAKMAALSTEGKILFPVEKKKKDDQERGYKQTARNQLISQAREGDEDAIESLTLEDMDTYSMISKRVQNEDILTIVTSYFMPYGIESDQYSILGEIIDLYTKENRVTEELIYCMKVECNDIIFDVCINAKDLLGQPAIGRRFKGNIWMQGELCL